MFRSMKGMLTVVSLIGLTLVGCQGEAETVSESALESGGSGKADRGEDIASDWKRGIDHMQLFLDVGDFSAQATLTLDPVDGGGETISLEARGLDVVDVFDARGELLWEVRDGGLHVELDGATQFTVDYIFEVQTASTGLSPAQSTVIWPTWCGNLFPCRSEPFDGMRFELIVTGYDDRDTAIYPEMLASDAPAYTLALAIGDYTCHDLGQTSADTSVGVCWLPGGKSDAVKGTEHLTAAFDWLETTLGPYTFGPEALSVAVDWGDGAAGGMEHHPYWHVAIGEMAYEITHIHEAAHGWFGTGVRMECWEDLVLSEGTVTYLAARALGAVSDEATEAAVWDTYREELLWAVETEDIQVLPESCGEVDLLKDGLWSNVVYMKGAFFFRALAQDVGAERLDEALGHFYRDHVGSAARMTDLLTSLEDQLGYDTKPLADHWLRTRGNPF